jgi:hypothetical protein
MDPGTGRPGAPYGVRIMSKRSEVTAVSAHLPTL